MKAPRRRLVNLPCGRVVEGDPAILKCSSESADAVAATEKTAAANAAPLGRTNPPRKNRRGLCGCGDTEAPRQTYRTPLSVNP